MNRTIASLTIGLICTISALGAALLLLKVSSHSEFVSKSLWDEFVLKTGNKSYSKANSSDIATGLSMADAQNFLTWINAKDHATYRLMTLEEFRNAAANNTLPDAANSVKAWLSDCFEDESFHSPSNTERKLLGLPENWPHKINMLGQICKTNPCLSCKLAWFEDGEVHVQTVFEQYPPPNIGLLLVR